MPELFQRLILRMVDIRLRTNQDITRVEKYHLRLVVTMDMRHLRLSEIKLGVVLNSLTSATCFEMLFDIPTASSGSKLYCSALAFSSSFVGHESPLRSFSRSRLPCATDVVRRLSLLYETFPHDIHL